MTERKPTDRPSGVRASELTDELVRVRQRGIGRLDLVAHNLGPVSVDRLYEMGLRYAAVVGRVASNRNAAVSGLLVDGLAVYRSRGNAEAADRIELLFFDPDRPADPFPRRSPGELLDLAREKFGPSDEKLFASARKVWFRAFASFLIDFVDDAESGRIGDTDSKRNASLDVSVQWPQLDREIRGLWHSTYHYTSHSRPGAELESHHYIWFEPQSAAHVAGKSLPNKEGSVVRLSLHLDGSIASGTWSETTSPSGHYGGVTYHGVIQVVVDLQGRHLRGKWSGFDSEFNVRSGNWELDWISGNRSDIARYVAKI